METNREGNKGNSLNKHKSKTHNLTFRDMVSIVAVFLVTVIAALFIALNFNSESGNLVIEDRYKSFSTGWRLHTNDKDVIVDLPIEVEIEPNESITLSRDLPEVHEYYAVATRNYHQRIKVSVGEKELYDFPQESFLLSRGVITDDWNMIHLDEEMTGDTLTIQFTAEYHGFKGYIQPVYIGEDNALVQYLRANAALPYGMAVSVLALGIALLILGIIYSKYNEDKSQIIAGLMLVAIGVWVTNRSKMPLLLVGSSVKFYLAFVSLMIESVLILLYVGEKFKRKNKALTNKLTFICFLFVVAVMALVLVLRYPIEKAVPFGYGAIFLASVYLIYMLWPISYGKESKNFNDYILRSNRIEFIATCFMVIGVCIGIFFDFVVGQARMFTDVGALPKIALNGYAVGQLLVHIYRGYHGVEEREVLQSKLHDSQMELMMGQIQPHFIFNTLSSIRTLVKVDPDTAYNMIYDFSNYLRANVDNVTNLDGINFASEVEHIKSYVNIEKVRFGERIEVIYDIQDTDFIVPPLSIQPLVENAIKHGVTKKVSGGTVWLKSYEEGNYNVVEVRDNGAGFTPERLEEIRNSFTDDEYESNAQINLTGNGSEQHKSSGMRNIYLRLREMADAEFELESVEGEGTKVRVLFPKANHS